MVARKHFHPEVRMHRNCEYDTKTALLSQIISPLPAPQYTIDCQFASIERQLSNYQKDWGLNLDPDFQRGHVWTTEQRIAFVEGMFRGTVGESQRVIQFNAPHWNNDKHGGDLPDEIQIIDGLQRLTAVRRFLAGEFCIFNGLCVDDFEGSRYSVKMGFHRLRFAIHSFAFRHDLLRYYLDINTGGTPHSQDEIERVRRLLTVAQG